MDIQEATEKSALSTRSEVVLAVLAGFVVLAAWMMIRIFASGLLDHSSKLAFAHGTNEFPWFVLVLRHTNFLLRSHWFVTSTALLFALLCLVNPPNKSRTTSALIVLSIGLVLLGYALANCLTSAWLLDRALADGRFQQTSPFEAARHQDSLSQSGPGRRTTP